MKKRLAICGVLFLLAWLGMFVIIETLTEQDAVTRWKDQGNFAQYSIFFTDYVETDWEEIDASCIELRGAKEEEGIRQAVAYCSWENFDLSGRGVAVKLKTMIFGGEFFLFHPLELLEGSYPDRNHGTFQVLLDEGSAYALFGSAEVTGLEVTLGRQSFIVSGVVKGEQRLGAAQAGNWVEENQEPGWVYIPYEALIAEMAPQVQCIETVVAEPVKGAGEAQLRGWISQITGSYEIDRNTDRFCWKHFFENPGEIITGAMVLDRAERPYWENLARGAQVIVFFLRVIQVLCVIWALTEAACLLKRGVRLQGRRWPPFVVK